MAYESSMPSGLAHFERYVGIVCELHVAPEHPKAVTSENLELCLDSGYRSLRGILKLCGAGVADASQRNTLTVGSGWQEFVKVIHDKVYNQNPSIITKEAWMVSLLKPNPLLALNAPSRFGRPQGFLFSHLMQDVPVASDYVPLVQQIDARRTAVRRGRQAP